MSSVAEIDDLKRQLEADEVTWEEVIAKITSSRNKPWNKAAWKNSRKELLANQCGACGSTTPPFVLQHVWHPRPFSYWCNWVRDYLINQTDYLALHPFPKPVQDIDPNDVPPQPVEIRQVCPHCQSKNIRQLKDGTWNCLYSGKKGTCYRSFTAPLILEHRKYKPEVWLHWHAKRAWWQEFMAMYRPTILKCATLLSLDEFRRYVSLLEEDVTTRCKKCACREDRFFIQGNYELGVIEEDLRRKNMNN